MTAITAFLIVKDEERALPACLDSIDTCVDAIVVLDTGSTDGTCDYLARRAARAEGPPLSWDRVPFTGFGPTRQLALDRVTTPWALWLDADETVSPSLAAALQQLRRDGRLGDHDAWRLRRASRVLGHVMRQRNLARERVVRLFQPATARITPTPVHEGVELPTSASIGDIDAPLWHDTLVSWREYLAKVDHYTTLDAQRQIRPASWLHLLVGTPAAFLRNYVGRGGIVDGWPGLVWAVTSAWSSCLLDWKLLRARGQVFNRNCR